MERDTILKVCLISLSVFSLVACAITIISSDKYADSCNEHWQEQMNECGCYKSSLLFNDSFALEWRTSTAPPIITEWGWNHSLAKEVVFSIPPEYYKHVDSIRFINDLIYEDNGTYIGYMTTRWGADHNCYDTFIYIYDPDNPQATLLHELGHVYEYCVLKQNDSTEEFAEAFPHNIK